ncbi:2-dehydropantoate 2-reductase [Friedmanniella endophytica]|uniref:2-dehydropantoate 2-reductase n=1 Tax=Microlunatus kandeliicorticis TaxID=1759536 RepID=A0A7W3IW38_9ACTN|nr:2-dehydropantoate 2-reductase N-terminal domain-containing protein [Microlunatus kandeliicorticis]MBA8796225.1 2-dehydropantoate 2-reductase [Microlunatus kandeliicorticis]
MTRYVIIGAGAIGSAVGGCLAAAGRSAVLVGRQAHVDAVRSQGLRVRTPESDRRVPVEAVTGPDELRLTTDDVLVLSTKTHQAVTALAEWADADVVDPDSGERVGAAWERLPVCTALNGVTSESMALRYFTRVFAVCVWMPAVYLEPGEVIVRATPRRGIFHVGAYHRSGDETARQADATLLDTLRDDWRAADCEVVVTDEVMAWKYRKLLSNLGNSVQALVGEGDPAPVLAAADREARAVLEGCGIAYTDDATEQAARDDSFSVAPVAGEPDRLGGSSWQSLARGTGTIETDYLNGEIARLAREHGLAAPVNERLAALARTAAKQGTGPGSLSAEELAARLGL